MKKWIGFPVLLFFIISNIIAGVNYEGNQLTLENKKLKQVFQINKDTSGPFLITKINYTEAASFQLKKDHFPYFEFILDGQKINNFSNIWKFKEVDSTSLPNGSRIFNIKIQGAIEPWGDLVVEITQQLFPESTLIRERLSIHTKGTVYHLSKKNDQLHFIFPGYSLSGSTPVASHEIRMGTSGKEIIDYDPKTTYDDRKFDGGAYFNLAHNHMFHPNHITYNADQEDLILNIKGPLNILQTKDYSWLSTYEHASQDSRTGMEETGNTQLSGGKLSADGMQGIEGTFESPKTDNDFQFLGILQKLGTDQMQVKTSILRGGYLDGEAISPDNPYRTVWTSCALDTDTSFSSNLSLFHHYIYRQIYPDTTSRKPAFYYNTWGMQRDMASKSHDLREILTEKCLLEEIERTAELNVDLFVLDDGWNISQGTWKPHQERLPKGLKPIRKALEQHDIKMGIWLSPMGIAKETKRYKNHPEWVIKDDKGEPISAQWGHPAFDFVSDFYELFIDDCKWLVDQGVRFFKWDAINTFNSSLANLHHGSDKYSKEERRARYEYLLPIYVSRAMKELTKYEPELVIEIDLTEARRAMVGLAPLQYGKFFWMNNGASGYGDYSTYRAKSTRAIPNHFAKYLPLEIFTYANYPHNPWPFFAQRYNVNSSLISGYGFWGNLEDMNHQQRVRVGKKVRKCKRILPYITPGNPTIKGPVGGSPEIYTMINKKKAAGQIIAFSSIAKAYTHKEKINTNQLLAVLNHSYSGKDSILSIPFVFKMPDDSREAFLLPSPINGLSIKKSTCWLDNAQFDENNNLTYITGDQGSQVIQWPKKIGKPIIPSSDLYQAQVIKESNDHFKISIKNKEACQIVISTEK